MSLDAEYPPPFKLKKNELKTLKFLYTQTYITKHFPELASAAEIYYYNLRDVQNTYEYLHKNPGLYSQSRNIKKYLNYFNSRKNIIYTFLFWSN